METKLQILDFINPYNQLLEPIPDDMFDEPRDKPSRDFAIFKIRNIGGILFFTKNFLAAIPFLEIYCNYLKSLVILITSIIF